MSEHEKLLSVTAEIKSIIENAIRDVDKSRYYGLAERDEVLHIIVGMRESQRLVSDYLSGEIDKLEEGL